MLLGSPHPDRAQLLGVVLEPLRARELGRIKASLPFGEVVARGTDAQSQGRHRVKPSFTLLDRGVRRMNTLKFTSVALVFAFAACGTSAETERKLAELETANAQKDSLMQEVAISSRLISDVNTELAKAKIRNNRLHVSSESPITASNDTLIAKLRYVVARVGETERALSDSRERIKGLTALSDSLRSTSDTTVGNLQSMVASQRTTID